MFIEQIDVPKTFVEIINVHFGYNREKQLKYARNDINTHVFPCFVS